ncbi:MAG: AAA family ATPase [Rubrivivax sp.]|nr:AAA family ATPase [Rubrivivax sp.]
MPDRATLRAAIEALEAQRGVLGDAVVDTATQPLREQLATLPEGGPAPQALKHVSVLFLDVVGPPLPEPAAEPEDVHVVVAEALARCGETVRAHGGKVMQTAGDGLLAAFGAPYAREDDAERAVRCGLALLAPAVQLRERARGRLGHQGWGLRVGIHTGPVLLGGGVDDDGTIRGATVNLAARMEQSAPPGALRISHDTWLQVRGVFDVAPQPPLRVKGFDEPLTTYLVERAKPRAFRVGTRGIEGIATPLVGRDAELAQLVAMLDEVSHQRALRATTLLGEPGLGKSRLLQELQAALETHPQRCWLLLGRAQPGSLGQPYGLLRDVLAWRLQIADSDSRDTAKAKIESGLLPWLGEQATAKAHRIGHLLGLDHADSPHVRGLEPRLLRTLGFAALTDYLSGLSADGAVAALLLEDLHWADEGSLDFLAHLVTVPDLPLLLVATARPELLERRPAWPAEAAAGPLHATIRLQALDAVLGDQLARALLRHVADGAPALRELLVAQAEGNPFYMEELLRMFIDDGVLRAGGDSWQLQHEQLQRARVPATLVGVLQARLDALPAADRLALQKASIVGHVFWDQALAAIDPQAPSAVPALQRRELVHPRDSSAFEGTAEAAFHHHLLHQVTYDTVLRPVRRAGHAAAAQWLAERVADRPAEYLAITGEHYERAGDLERAFDYYARAAHDAAARFANPIALEFAARALALPGIGDPRRRERLHFVRQSIADLLGDRELQVREMTIRNEIAEAIDDDPLRADVLLARSFLASRLSDETGARALAEQAAQISERSGYAEGQGAALAQLAWSRYSAGDVAGALACLGAAEQSLRVALQLDATSTRQQYEVQFLTLRSIFLISAGDLQGARAAALQGVALARERGLRRPLVSIAESLGSLAFDAGQYREGLAHYRSSVTGALEIGWTIYVAMGHYNMARCHHALGEAAAAADDMVIAEREAERCGYGDAVARCTLLKGRMHAAAGNPAAALAYLDRAASLFAAQETPAFVCQADGEAALVHLSQGDLPAACERVERIAAALASGVSLAPTEEPLRPRWACHQVWAALGDERAAAALESLHADLQARIALVDDEEMRSCMLQQVALHAEIVRAWEALTRP